MKKNIKSDAAILRQKAEELLKKKLSSSTSHSVQKTHHTTNLSENARQKLIHELEVHQIELEMQDEELKHAISSSPEAFFKYAELFDFVPSGHLTLSKEGKIIELNLSGAKMLGKDRSLLLNSPFSFFVSNDTKPFLIQFLRKVFSSKAKESCELKLSDIVNLPIYVHLTGILAENGEQCYITMVDISELKQADEAIRISEEKFRNIFENVQDVYYETTIDGIIVEISPSISSISKGQYKRDELIGKLMSDFYSNPETRQNILKAIQDKGFIHDYEITLRNKDGSLFQCSLVSKIQHDSQGKPVKIVGSMRNISERKQAEEKIKKLYAELEERVIRKTEQLEAANKELETFSYSISHDLRAPLRHINGFADILKKDYREQLPEEAQHYLDTIIGSAQKIGVLIDDLLDFSRTGRVELKKSTLQMKQVMNEALLQVKSSFSNRQIKWNISSLPEVHADHSLIRLVWINLLENAAKYTSTRGKAVIKVDYKEEKDEYVFSIQDNGVGFDMKYSQKLFGVFQRLHRIADFEGTGIGLANVRRIISRHGGRTWAEGEVDKGATFYFSLPKKE